MWLLSPLSWLLLAGLGACVGWRRRSRRALWACVAVAVVATAAMTPLVANGLLRWLERPRPVARVCRISPPQVAVVLAGGVDALSSDDNDASVLGMASRRRVERAVDWWRERPGRTLVMSGGSLWSAGVPESRWMARYAQRLGVPAAAMRSEEASSDTWENARNLAAMSPPLPQRVVLVSSALHMPRAEYAMQHAGFQPCPLATDWRQTRFGLPGYLIPRSSALEKTEASLHEFVGLIYYRWLGFRDHRN